jgi:lysozyme
VKKGIDISHFQGAIDWKKVKNDGVEFVMMKATQGTNYKYADYFRNQAPLALGNGLDVGAYHYGTFSTIPEAITEAKYFLSVVKDFKLTYPLVLDIEENKEKVSKTQLTSAAIAFMEVLENAKYFTMLYTGENFLTSSLDADKLKPYAKWIANYGKKLNVPADMWQYASDGKVDGISGDVDLNWSYQDFASIIANMNKPLIQSYTVRSGENLSKIAMRMNTTVQHLLLLNPQIKDKNIILPGQKIKVPVR